MSIDQELSHDRAKLDLELWKAHFEPWSLGTVTAAGAGCCWGIPVNATGACGPTCAMIARWIPAGGCSMGASGGSRTRGGMLNWNHMCRIAVHSGHWLIVAALVEHRNPLKGSSMIYTHLW